MARNGSGVYSLPAGNPVVDDTTIEASWANTTLSDIGAEITGSLPRNGAAPMTGTLGMGSNKILNLADGTAATDAATKGQVDGLFTAHVAAADPHPGYLTEVAAAAAYQPLDGELSAIAGLTSAADKVPRFTGSGTAELIDVAYGTYAPTVTAGVNAASASATGTFKYSRVGSIVTLSGWLSINATAASPTETIVYVSLPIASSMTAATDALGNTVAFWGLGGVVYSDHANDRLLVKFFADVTGTGSHLLTAQYVIL